MGKHSESIKRIIIEDGVLSIGEEAFSGCDKVTDITIHSSVKTISAYAFRGCEGLKELTIPASVTSIGFGLLCGCERPKIYYPAGRGFNKDWLLFCNRAHLIPYDVSSPAKQTSQLVFENKLRWKFDGKTLTVGGVRVIKDFSREEPPWLDNILDIQKIIVEEGVEKISANAFIDCKRLELLTIPASVKTIGDMAFTACFCGNRFVDGGRNVFWCVEDGVLIFKKNPAAKSDADFSTGSVSWLPVEKNITGFKLEPGIVPKEKFFEWLSKRGDALQASFA